MKKIVVVVDGKEISRKHRKQLHQDISCYVPYVVVGHLLESSMILVV